jgi:hypothetical protein
MNLQKLLIDVWKRSGLEKRKLEITRCKGWDASYKSGKIYIGLKIESSMTERQVEGVIGHEAHHAVKHRIESTSIIICALAMISFVAVELIILVTMGNTLFLQLSDIVLGATIIVCAFVFWLCLFTYVSRRLDLAADRFAAQIVGGNSYASTLKIILRNRKLGLIGRLRSWLTHFPLNKRVRTTIDVERLPYPKRKRSSEGSIGLTESLREKASRMAMYFGFIVLLFLALWICLNQLTYANENLVFVGAAELAYAFYAFSTGNSSFSIMATLIDKTVRNDVSFRAEAIIKAGRQISMGAILLIFSGIILLNYPQITLPLILLTYGLVSNSAYRLCENMEVVPNIYLISRNIKDYDDWKRKKASSRSSLVILVLSSLLLFIAFGLRTFYLPIQFVQTNDILILIGAWMLSISTVINYVVKQ